MSASRPWQVDLQAQLYFSNFEVSVAISEDGVLGLEPKLKISVSENFKDFSIGRQILDYSPARQ